MKRTILALGLLLALAPARAGAIGISLIPAALTGTVGVAFDVGVVVSGLGDGVAPSLGAFDLDIQFDAGVFAFDSASFGSELGAGSLQGSSSGGGVVNVAEVSLLSPAALDALQSGSVLVATLRFTPIALGTGTLGFGAVLAGDGFGDPLAITSLAGARIVVDRAIPEPGGLALFALGALLLAKVHERGRSQLNT